MLTNRWVCVTAEAAGIAAIPKMRTMPRTTTDFRTVMTFPQETGNSACDGDRGPGFMARYIYAAIVDPNELGATPSLYGYVNRIGNEPYDWHRYHSTGASHLWR